MNGVDPSCGAASPDHPGDKATFRACVTGKATDASQCKDTPEECYKITYAGTAANGQGYYRAKASDNDDDASGVIHGYPSTAAFGDKGSVTYSSGSEAGPLCKNSVGPPVVVPNSRIAMVNPADKGKVAAIEHGPFGAVPGAGLGELHYGEMG